MILDANTWSGHWHSRKFDINTVGRLHRHLAQAGITTAVVSSTDAVFCSDPEPWNRELAGTLAKYPLFIHVPVFKPTLANWHNVLASYAAGGIRAVRLLPGYHSYSLVSHAMQSVLEQCSEYGFTVFVQMRMEDEREHHALARIPRVSVDEMINAAVRFRNLSFVCLSACNDEAVSICGKTENVCFDTSFLEQMNTVAALMKDIPASRLLFGSHTPFFYTRAALMKMHYAEIGTDDRNSILAGNACRLLNIAVSR